MADLVAEISAFSAEQLNTIAAMSIFGARQLSVVGLCLDILGAWLLASDVIRVNNFKSKFNTTRNRLFEQMEEVNKRFGTLNAELKDPNSKSSRSAVVLRSQIKKLEEAANFTDPMLTFYKTSLNLISINDLTKGVSAITKLTSELAIFNRDNINDERDMFLGGNRRVIFAAICLTVGFFLQILAQIPATQ